MTTLHEIRSFEASDGYQIHYRYWPSAGACKGIVLGVHGIQSHSGWYKYSSRTLSEAGYTVYFADRRGSGLNGRRRGHADHGMRLIHDLRQLRELAVSEAADNSVPVAAMGISWGGRIVAAAAAEFPGEFDRLVLLYPGLVPMRKLSWFDRLRLTFSRRFEICRNHIPIPLDDPALFTSQRAWQQFIADDPLALHTVSSSFLNAGRDLDLIIRQNKKALTHPMLLMLAGRDQVINNQATRRLVTSFPSKHLAVQVWSDAQHTLEFEPDRETIFSELVHWLTAPSANSLRNGAILPMVPAETPANEVRERRTR